MKARSKKEREFVEMAGQLRPLSDRQKEWAKGLFPAEALYYSRRGNSCEFHCMCCGAVVRRPGKWNLADQVCDWTCPECGAVCKVLPRYNKDTWRNKAATTSRYVTLVDVFNGLQVFRTFDVWRSNGRTLEDGTVRGCPTEFRYHEVFQNWVLPSGQELITSRLYTRGFNHFTWEYSSEWQIGKHNAHTGGYYCFDDVYDVSGHWFFPKPRISSLLRRNGFTGRVLRVNGLDVIGVARRLLVDNLYEEVVKLGYIKVAGYLLDRKNVNIRDYICALRICARNGYRIDDAPLWFDYVNDLMFLGLDVHNAHYVCPPDLRAAHTRTYIRRRNLTDRQEREAQRKELVRYEESYAREKAAFLGIVFGDEKVTISVLKSVLDVWEEGKAMHHCVYTNEYFKKKDSILLSARDAAGKRLETVEIGLDSFQVLQSRGPMNGRTPFHDRILALCQSNMNAFRKAKAMMNNVG